MTTIAPPPPTDPAGFDVVVRGTSVHVAIEGTAGEPILLFHGIPGSVRDFRYLGPALLHAGQTPIRVDLPGFGASPRNPSLPLSNRERVSFVVELAAALGYSRFAVGGHSFGGGLALLTAADAPSHVSGLLLINSIGVVPHRAFPKVPSHVLRLLAKAVGAPVVGDRIVQRARALYKKIGLPSEISASDLAYHAQLIAAVEFAVHRAAARTITCPVLLATAWDDRVVDPEASFEFAETFSSSSRFHHYHAKTGGHFLQKHDATPIADRFAALLP